MALSDIETIVIVALENRSFDHMLGYLSLPGGPAGVEGLGPNQGGDASYSNLFNNQSYPVVRLGPEVETIADPDHSRPSIAVQITTPAQGGQPMGGFVSSYATRTTPVPPQPSLAMGHYDQESLPVFDFFARNFTTCDHWFSALPASTQINRLMLLTGQSSIADNESGPFLIGPTVYDWLGAHGVTWCVYKKGSPFPFVALDPTKIVPILASMAFTPSTGAFRRYDHFAEMWAAADPAPQVIFVEPEYSEGPRSGPPCDDHSPTGVAGGQAFLADIYSTIISNPSKWARTLMIVTYDEHGGFFDHVPPLQIPQQAGGVQFTTTGVRVPAFLISPQVDACEVFQGPLDHTSILQLLDDRFVSGQGYSDSVNARQAHPLNRISQVLKPPSDPVRAPPIPPAILASVNQAAAGSAPQLLTGASANDTANAQAMHRAAVQVAQQHPDLIAHPELQDVRDYLDQTAGPPPPEAQ